MQLTLKLDAHAYDTWGWKPRPEAFLQPTLVQDEKLNKRVSTRSQVRNLARQERVLKKAANVTKALRHKYAAAARSFCFVTTKKGEQQDVCNLATMPCVQRSLCLNEVTDDFGNIKVEVQKELTVEPETCCNAVWLSVHLEYRSRVDNEVFNLIDKRKVNPRKCVTGRWVLTIKTDKQGNFLRPKAADGY